MAHPFADIGKTMRDARERLELTQSQMAERLDRTQVQISKWETGESLPRTEDVRAVAREYKLKPEQLLPRVGAS
jgi:transcriptional regulator with XRE-family HTH domain